MKPGDIVKIKEQPLSNSHSFLTTVMFYARLKLDVGDNVGIITAISGKSAIIQFSNMRKVIHKDFLEVLND